MVSQASEVPKVVNCVLGKEQGIGKQKTCQKAPFLDKNSQQIRPKIFGAT